MNWKPLIFKHGVCKILFSVALCQKFREPLELDDFFGKSSRLIRDFFWSLVAFPYKRVKLFSIHFGLRRCSTSKYLKVCNSDDKPRPKPTLEDTHQIITTPKSQNSICQTQIEGMPSCISIAVKIGFVKKVLPSIAPGP